MLLAACSQQSTKHSNPVASQAAANAIVPASATSPDEVVSAQNSHSPAAAASDAGKDQGGGTSATRDCYLKVDGAVDVDGPCLVFPMGGDDYTLNTWDKGKPARSHFAAVTTNPDGKTVATWNADPDDDRALDPLGNVLKEGDCWINDRARICAR